MTNLCLSLFFAFSLYLLPTQNSFAAYYDTACTGAATDVINSTCGYPGPDGSGLPLCADVSVSSDPIHRENCMDLIDLPICADITGGVAGYSCINECSTITNVDNEIRGTDYAVHGTDCVRFCDSPETDDITTEEGVNCRDRYCHQMPESGNDPDGANCTLLDCNLLNMSELIGYNSKIYNNSDNQYCDGSSVKCYEFIQEKLPYVIYRATNTMCQMHTCLMSVVDSPYCSDETSKITDQGTDYETDYETYINAGMDITEGFCQLTSCKGIYDRMYVCDDKDGDDVRDDVSSDCDATSTCSNNYCTKEIDCNNPDNSEEQECKTYTDDEDEDATIKDTYSAWFYRPSPASSILYKDGNGLKNGKIDPTIIITQEDQDNFCYTPHQMKTNEGGSWGDTATFKWPWGGKISTYWHGRTSGLRIPGMCESDADRLGVRNFGYISLAGVDGYLLYNEPDSDDPTGYIKGYAYADYELDDPEYRIRACLRFNGGEPTAHGKRSCRVDCLFDACTQYCGKDVCRTLVTTDKDDWECSYTQNTNNMNGMSGNLSFPDCAKTVDSFLRLRVQRSDRYLCVFLDLNGTTAYPGEDDYLDGTETFNNGTECIGGEDVAEGKCSGYDTNHNPSAFTVWRTVMMIPYIGNARTDGGTPGYYDLSGKFYYQQDCAKVPLRLGPDKLYYVATMDNSQDLFSPPLYIAQANVIRGGTVSPATDGDNYGKTDFFYPEIKVQFGSLTKLMSLGAGYIGQDSGDSASEDTITTTYNNVNYSASLYVLKEYDAGTGKPVFCLYRVFYDDTVATVKEIDCVDRNEPEIDGSVTGLDGDDSTRIRKAVVTAGSNNSYNSASINLKLMIHQGDDDIDEDCDGKDDYCSTGISLSDLDLTGDDCSYVEKQEFCAEREECSELYNECADNEINLANAISLGDSTSEYKIIQSDCNDSLLPYCNAKKGISVTSAADIFDQTDSNITKISGAENAYGWFNEICISKGFDNKLEEVNVLAYKVDDGEIKGKCVIDQLNSPYLTDKDDSDNDDTTTNCDDGGQYPNCICKEDADPSGADEITTTSRTITAREAGLCIDIPEPNFCEVISYIDHSKIDNINSSTDPYYSSSSLNQTSLVANSVDKTAYSDNGGTSGVDISHYYRTYGDDAAGITMRAHGEFPSVLGGINYVEGECRGFWKNATKNGVELTPTVDCQADGTWGTNTENICVRYSCARINSSLTWDSSITDETVKDYSYTNSYVPSSNGYALWPTTTSSDFPETISATSCITGYQAVGSYLAATTDTSFTGGILPTRTCSQLGVWNSDISNVCERVRCDAVSPTVPTTTMSDAEKLIAYNEWYDAGGATFDATDASRLVEYTTAGAKSEGVCNGTLGFVAGTSPPTRNCNYLGQWEDVVNPCTSSCDAIDATAALNSNNGYAIWPEVLEVAVNDDPDKYISVNALGLDPDDGSSYTNYAAGSIACATDYTEDPYAKNPLTINGQTTNMPYRACKSVVTALGDTNVWGDVTNPCVNTCPEDTDKVTLSSGEITVTWPATTLGDTAYINSEATYPDASDFISGRSNGVYIISRACGSDGRWSDTVTSLCSVGDNSGAEIGNATYYVNSSTYKNWYERTLIAGSSSTVTGTCISSSSKGYYTADGSLPIRECKCEDNNCYPDKIYLALKSGSNDCKELTCTLTSATGLIATKSGYGYINSVLYPFADKNAYYSYSTIFSILTSKVTGDPTLDIGSTETLRCDSGYGSAIADDSNNYGNRTISDDDYLCTDTESTSVVDRVSNQPYLKCEVGNNGTTASVVLYDDCDECRKSCNESSSIAANSSCTVYEGQCNAKNGREFNAADMLVNSDTTGNKTALHGDSINLNLSDHNKGCVDDIDGEYYKAWVIMTCKDGVYYVDSMDCYENG